MQVVGPARRYGHAMAVPVVLFALLIIASVPVTAAVTRKRILRNRLYLDEHTRKEIAELETDNERLRRELERADRRNRELTSMVRAAMCSLTGVESNEGRYE